MQMLQALMQKALFALIAWLKKKHGSRVCQDELLTQIDAFR